MLRLPPKLQAPACNWQKRDVAVKILTMPRLEPLVNNHIHPPRTWICWRGKFTKFSNAASRANAAEKDKKEVNHEWYTSQSQNYDSRGSSPR